jgi:hypothetical protein
MRRIFALLLTVGLAFGLALPCQAAGAGMANFQKISTYSGQFADVPETHWGLSAVKTCYEYGLMKGASDTAFLPGGTLTRAEAVVMASRLHEIYSTGQSTLANGSPWYQPYVDYAVENKILDAGAFDDYTAPATRGEMAQIFCRALPESELESIRSVQSVRGVPQDHLYARAIYVLYEAGVLTGSDQYGSFAPDDPITRVEAAAILSRMALPQERKDTVLMLPLTWQDSILSFLSVDMPQGSQALGNTSVYYQDETGAYIVVTVNVFQNNTCPGGSTYDCLPTEEAMLEHVNDTLLYPARNAVCNAVSYGAVDAYRTVMDVEMDGSTNKLGVIFFARGDYLFDISIESTMEDLELFHQVINGIRVDGSQVSSLWTSPAD